jgi:uncharacterized protein (DUF1800 family)
MKRFALAFAAFGLAVAALPLVAGSKPPAHKAIAKPTPKIITNLTPDEQIVHVLNRLTFGPRPGDIEEVRRVGIDKWIDLQLHPDRIAENPLLNDKLKPFETLRLNSAEILKDYPQIAPGVMMMRMTPMTDLLKQDQTNKLFSGTIEERKAVMDSLDPEKRKQVLLSIGPQQFNVIPELKKEAEDARKAQQEERQAEMKRRTPPLEDLLDSAQRDIVRKGTPAQIAALLESFDPTKRQQIASAMPRPQLAGLPELRRLGIELRQPQEVVISDLREGKVLRAVYSNRQLEEVLVDFWFNHFNVYEGKMSERPLLASYERDAIRPHVLGHFKDLLLATAHHPAMLYYLDNWESIAPGAFDIGPFAPPVEQMARELARRARGLNENYGRELLELHTLGVNGGYTQDDVIAVARCFTGWTIAKPATDPQFVFAPFMHDEGAKVVLGHTIAAGGGESDGLQVIDILAHHPSTAKFISKELAQRFVSDNPSPALIDRMTQTFIKTEGDLRAVLSTMFNSSEFYSDAAWQSKMKSPLEMVVSAVRATGGDALDGFALAQRVADLGEPLYGKLEPTGYPNTGDAWLNTASLFARMNFASALTGGNLPGVKFDLQGLEGKDAGAIARQLLGHDVSEQTRDVMGGTADGKPQPPRTIAALIIGSPDFQKR